MLCEVTNTFLYYNCTQSQDSGPEMCEMKFALRQPSCCRGERPESDEIGSGSGYGCIILRENCSASLD